MIFFRFSFSIIIFAIIDAITTANVINQNLYENRNVTEESDSARGVKNKSKRMLRIITEPNHFLPNKITHAEQTTPSKRLNTIHPVYPKSI